MERVERSTIWVTAAVISPLIVALVALWWRPWVPVLDLAMTELRIRDVGGRFTPRIGLQGRIGEFPDRGSHPGPWSFYLLAPWYRLAGASSWGMQFGSVVVNSVAFAGVVATGHRIAGRRGALALAAIASLAIRGFGLNMLTHPWNPYFPLAMWLLLLVAAWAVMVGHHRFAIVVAVCATVSVQTHVPYLLSCVAVAVLVLVALLVRRRRTDPGDRGPVTTSLGTALGVTVVLWIPPLVDQLREDPGNMTRLFRHFTGEPDEALVSTTGALRVFLRHLDAPGALVRMLFDSHAFFTLGGDPYRGGVTASMVGGLLTLSVWVVAAWWAHRRGHRLLNGLNTVLAVALAAGAVSISRIFGKVWFYLTLWAWSTMLLVVLSVAWTAWLVLRESRPVSRHAPDWLAVAVVGVASALSLGAVVTQSVPEPQLSAGVEAILPDTIAAIDSGVGESVGPDGRYLVYWQDTAHIGAQGFGLLNELERDGFDVGVRAPWYVPATPHRVVADNSVDAEIHLVTGSDIDTWRSRPDLIEVAWADPRSDDDRERFDELRARVDQRLGELGRPDLAAEVDRNLFVTSLDPALPQDVIDDLAEMLLIGVPVAVFIAPPGASR